ncbi:MAG: hypothetical protein ACRC5R_01495 [Mycoplasmatales bacterium]
MQTKEIEMNITETKTKQIKFQHDSPSEEITNIIINSTYTKAKIINKLNKDSNFYKNLNGLRPLERYDSIAILIIVGFSTIDIDKFLKKNGYQSLYVKNKKDYLIYKNCVYGSTIEKINEILELNNEVCLCY